MDRRGLKINIEEGWWGGASYDKHGTPLTEEMLKKALEVNAVLLGAVGGPNYDNLNFDMKPERTFETEKGTRPFCQYPSRHVSMH